MTKSELFLVSSDVPEDTATDLMTAELVDFLNGLPSVKKVRVLSAQQQSTLDLTKESPVLRRSIIRAGNSMTETN